MRLTLAIWLALSAVAAPPLFRAQNGAPTAETNVLDGFTHYWLADDIAGVDGDPVGTWPDGIASNDATAAGSERPTLRTAAINGKNAAEYDGVNDTTALSSGISAGTGWVICEVRYRATGTDKMVALASNDASSFPYSAYHFGDGNVYVGTSAAAALKANAETGWSVIVTTANAGTLSVRIDGSALTGLTYGSGGGSNVFNRLGRRDFGSEFSQGKLAFVGIVVGAPDPAFIAAFEAWAASYYGLP